MTATFATKDDVLSWIADWLGSESTQQDAELIWQYGRDHDLIVHDGRDFEISPDLDLLAALEDSQRTIT